MGPKKKEKSKEADWLECSLCKKWITPSSAEQHSKSCDSIHPHIFNYCLSGKSVKAEELKDEEGCQVTKSMKRKDDTLWMAIPTMNICGFSIGQNVVVNETTVKRVWPLRGLPLSHIGLSQDARNDLNINEGSLVNVSKLMWDHQVVHSLVLCLKDSNSIFEKEEFGHFLSSHLDGRFVTLDTPFSIRYFGQICHCVVTDIQIQNGDQVLHSRSLIPAKLSDALTEKVLAESLQESSETHSPMETPKKNRKEKTLDSEVSDLLNVSKLTESFTEMDISNTSSVTDSPLQETPVKVKYPNLVTPLKTASDLSISDPPSSKVFGKIVSGYSKISVQPSSLVLNAVNKSGKNFSLKDVGGLSQQIEVLIKRISQGLQPSSFSKCILVQGPPGTGKSLCVRAVTSHLQMHTVYVHGTDIWSKLFGEAETNLKKIFASSQERSPSIIVFDDLHVICPKRSPNYAGQQEHRIVGTLLSLIDGVTNSRESASQQTVIVGITNDVDAVDQALRRAGRFGCEVEIGVPTSQQRAEILSIILKKASHSLMPDEIKTVAHNAHGYVGADLAALVNEAFIHAMNKCAMDGSTLTDLSSVSISIDDLVYAGHLIKPSALREIQLEVPQVKWTDIGGMAEVKMRLKEAVEIPLTHPELYRNLGIEPPKGLLMYGPPGCSKTMIAKAVATECHLNFLAVKGPELFNQYVGESEKNIRQVFHKAKSAAPSVIFFDEIDAIAATRGSSSGGSSGVDDRVLTQLLTEMDGLENLKDVFIMAATNRPDKIDKALLRPGRFDSLIYVPLPDDNTRREILQNKLKKMGVAENVNVDDLVEATLDYSGAEIIQMCQEAALCALRENINTQAVEQRHFDEALKKVLPQIDVELLKIYQKFSSRR